MEIKKLPIKSIVSNTGQIPDVPANPRFIKDEKFALLVQSLQDDPEIMEGRPVWVFPFDGQFVAIGGNMRHKAAKELKWKEINCCILPPDYPAAKIRAIIIKDNASFGSNDWDMLANEWDSEELAAWGMDLPETFAAEELEAVEDDYTEPDQMQVDVVLGDLIEIGQHRLLCGDSTDVGQVERLMGGEKADMVFTDPPYNVAFNGRSGNFDVIKNDNLSDVDFDNFIEDFAKTLNCFNIPIKYIWCNWKFYGTIQKHFDFKACIVWAKNVFGLGIGYRHQHEFCLFDGKIDDNIKNESDLWEVAKDSNYMHPTQKPIELASRAIKNHKSVNLIVDFFCGSGSTMVAAHQLKRRCFGMELDPKYCQVIIDRMQKLDPKLEVKINGKPYKKDVPF